MTFNLCKIRNSTRAEQVTSLHDLQPIMPDNRRIQGPETSHCPLLYLREEEKPSGKPLLRSDGSRQDGRKANEIRPMFLNTGVNPRATGSAYVELTNTKIFCAIFGPKESPRRDEFVPQGKLTCEFKFAPFSCPHRRQYQQDQQERDYSSLVVQALQRVVRLETFPKLQLEINIMVLENGGNALAASLVCATLALVDSGVEMLDTPTACSVVLHESGFWVDPALVEEYRGDPVVSHPSIRGSLMVVYLPSLDEVTALKQTGVMKHEDVLKGIDLCVEGCMRVHHRMREFLTEETTKHGREKHTQTSVK